MGRSSPEAYRLLSQVAARHGSLLDYYDVASLSRAGPYTFKRHPGHYTYCSKPSRRLESTADAKSRSTRRRLQSTPIAHARRVVSRYLGVRPL